MSDPFANTTTVKNILQHVLSPKIVRDGSGGYTTKVDLVNVDRVVLNDPRGSGTISDPFTGQCGSVTIGSGENQISVFATGLTANSVVFAVNAVNDEPGVESVGIDGANTHFIIRLRDPTSRPTRIGWFIAKF